MRRLAMILIIGAGACIVFSVRAEASGSISFEEVMGLARQNPKLVKEIEEVMRVQRSRRPKYHVRQGGSAIIGSTLVVGAPSQWVALSGNVNLE